MFPEHVWGSYLVYYPYPNGCHEWCHGLHVWILLWPDSTHSAQPQKDMVTAHVCHLMLLLGWSSLSSSPVPLHREGFIGGGLSTVVLSIFLSYFMCQYSYFICPIGKCACFCHYYCPTKVNNMDLHLCPFLEYSEELGRMSHSSCNLPQSFLPQEYTLPETILALRKVLVSTETHSLLCSITLQLPPPSSLVGSCKFNWHTILTYYTYIVHFSRSLVEVAF